MKLLVLIHENARKIMGKVYKINGFSFFFHFFFLKQEYQEGSKSPVKHQNGQSCNNRKQQNQAPFHLSDHLEKHYCINAI